MLYIEQNIVTCDFNLFPLDFIKLDVQLLSTVQVFLKGVIRSDCAN